MGEPEVVTPREVPHESRMNSKLTITLMCLAFIGTCAAAPMKPSPDAVVPEKSSKTGIDAIVPENPWSGSRSDTVLPESPEYIFAEESGHAACDASSLNANCNSTRASGADAATMPSGETCWTSNCASYAARRGVATCFDGTFFSPDCTTTSADTRLCYNCHDMGTYCDGQMCFDLDPADQYFDPGTLLSCGHTHGTAADLITECHSCTSRFCLAATATISKCYLCDSIESAGTEIASDRKAIPLPDGTGNFYNCNAEQKGCPWVHDDAPYVVVDPDDDEYPSGTLFSQQVTPRNMWELWAGQPCDAITALTDDNVNIGDCTQPV